MKQFISLILLITATPLYAQWVETNQQSDMYVGASLLDFTYKEFDDDNVLLDREDGLIPGFIMGYKQKGNNLITDVFFSYHATDIQYDGQTQSGVPVTTRSDADIYEFQAKIASEFRTRGNYQYEMYGGVGYRFWQRNIRSTAAATGIFEEYDWTYLMLGAKFPLMKTSGSSLDFDIQYTRMIQANIFVQLSSLGADDVNLALGKENGYRFSLPWRMQAQSSSVWVIEPYYESWEIGKSEIKPITVGGIPTGFVVWEPRSETGNSGVNIKMVMPF